MSSILLVPVRHGLEREKIVLLTALDEVNRAKGTPAYVLKCLVLCGINRSAVKLATEVEDEFSACVLRRRR